MITKEALQDVNKRIVKVEIKGKNYALVPSRVAAFREMCPDGLISTSIIEHENGVVTMVATVKDENGKVLATGFAQEKENSSYINKTSYIENCETSAVGRALGFLGIGSDENMASAEELMNALTNQEAMKQTETTKTITSTEAKSLAKLATDERIAKIVANYPENEQKIREQLANTATLTPSQYAWYLKELHKDED